MNDCDECFVNGSIDKMKENAVPADIEGQQTQHKYKPSDDNESEKEHTRLVT